MKFNEWLTKRDDEFNELGSGNLGLETRHDYELLSNQLSQLKDRLAGLLNDLNPPMKKDLINKFISDVKKECAA